VSSRLERETPNSWKANQYDNPSTPRRTTSRRGGNLGTDRGAVDHLVVGSGRRHHLCVAKYLKERKPSVKAWASTLRVGVQEVQETGVFDKNEIYPYITEGIGEDSCEERTSPDRSLREGDDRDAGHHEGRHAREEGIFAGNSAGRHGRAVAACRSLQGR